MTENDAYKNGMRVRREVLGDEHVERAIEATTDFTAPFQDFITRFAWGSVWTREDLDRRTRSAVTLAVLAALGREGELAIHAHGRAPQRLDAGGDRWSSASHRGARRECSVRDRPSGAGRGGVGMIIGPRVASPAANLSKMGDVARPLPNKLLIAGEWRDAASGATHDPRALM